MKEMKNKSLLLIVLCTMSIFQGYSNTNYSTMIINKIDHSNIDSIYFDSASTHDYVLAESIVLDSLSLDDYKINLYVDVAFYQYYYAKDTLFSFSRMEFVYKNKQIACYDNDDCWTYIERKSKKICKMHTIRDATCLVIRGCGYSDDLPSLSIFLLYNNNIYLVYHNEDEQILNIVTNNGITEYSCLCELAQPIEGSKPKYSKIIINDRGIYRNNISGNEYKEIFVWDFDRCIVSGIREIPFTIEERYLP